MNFSLFNRNNIAVIAVRVFTMCAGVITSVITAHSLGVNGRGELVAVTTFCLIIANFSNLGIPSSNTFHISSDIKLVGALFYNSLYISILGGGLGVLFGSFYFEDAGICLLYRQLFVFFYIFTIMFCNFCGNILIAINKIKTYNIIDIVQNAVILIFYYFGYLFKLPLYFYLVVALFGTSLGCILGLWNLRHHVCGSIVFDFVLFKKSLIFGFKVFITTFIAFLIAKGNVFILSNTRSVRDVGLFSVALQLYETIAIIPASISLLFFPHLIKIHRDYRFASMMTVLKQMSILMLVICIVSYFLFPFVVPFIFGREFNNAIEISIALLPGAFFLGIMSIVSQYLASSGYPIIQVIIWVLALVLWIVFSYLFVPTYGPKAIAIILALTNFFIFMSLYIVSWKYNYNEK